MTFPTVITASVALAAYLRSHRCILEKVELGEREGKPEFLFFLNGMNATLYHHQWLSEKESPSCALVSSVLSEALELFRRADRGAV